MLKCCACVAVCILLGLAQILIWKELIHNEIHANEKEAAASAEKILLHEYPILALDHSKWIGHPGRSVSVCAVVRTWVGHSTTLGTSLSSIATASHDEVSIHVIDTGWKAPFTSLGKIVDEFNRLVGFEMAKIANWTSSNSRPLFPISSDIEDWGYIATDMLIGDMVRWNAQAEESGRKKPCMAFYFTNGDNLMARSFFLHTLDAIALGHNIVATNFIHRMHDYKLKGAVFNSEQEMQTTEACGGWRPGLDMEFITQFRRRCVDLAAVVSNASMWERGKYGQRFIINNLGKEGVLHGKSLWRALFTADGGVFGTLASFADAKPYFVRRALIIHQ
jgi:hypothetical protein